MRILFFSHYFPPEGNAPASRTYENCKCWVRHGHKVTVVTCAPNVPDGVVYDGHKNKLYQSENIDGIHVIRVWTYIAANKGTIRRILNYVSYMFSAVFVSLFLKKPNLIIATSRIEKEFERSNKKLSNVLRRGLSRQKLYLSDPKSLLIDLKRAIKWLMP